MNIATHAVRLAVDAMPIMNKLTYNGLKELADRLRRIHPELDPSWSNLIELYANAWIQQLGNEEKRANELMLERDGLSREL